MPQSCMNVAGYAPGLASEPIVKNTSIVCRWFEKLTGCSIGIAPLLAVAQVPLADCPPEVRTVLLGQGDPLVIREWIVGLRNHLNSFAPHQPL